MLDITIQGRGQFKFSHLVLDYNGTLAVDGVLIEGIAPYLNELAEKLQIHVITGDTFGKARAELANVQCKLTILNPENQVLAKVHYLRQLHEQETIAIGNGYNDHQLLKEATIGIAVVGDEGAATETIMAADLVVPTIFTALGLLQNTRRLLATLRT